MITKPEKIYAEITSSLIRSGLFSRDGNGDGETNTWRISPEPYFLSPGEVEFFSGLGNHLLKFYTVLNRFYYDSIKGKLPRWFAEYLDAGKPPHLIDYGRMKRFRGDLPGIIRPDVIVTENGFAVTELDSVPGGFGATARLMSIYRREGAEMIGAGEGGIPELFYKMAESMAGIEGCALGIVISDEARDYKQEMRFLASLLREKGFPVYAVHPREVRFKEEGLFIEEGNREIQLDVVYRFFELFDLKNIPKSDLFMYSNKKGRVKTTPPYKTHLEEKLSFALFHHPALSPFWEKALGVETFTTLSHLIPKTWVLDHRELPPHGIIPGLTLKGTPVRDWRELFPLTQKERQLVVKPSGFSPESWGSRGVVIGHDVSSAEWRQTLEESLARFPEQPSVLQVFHKGKVIRASYVHPQAESAIEMKARARLTPYYFVVKGSARLGGILATLCPQDKKKIHGMEDAILIPCALKKGTGIYANAVSAGEK